MNMSVLPQRSPVDLRFSNIIYAPTPEKNKPPKIILKGVSGRFEPGRLAAIMGPSGAGKTTLLNILSGYRISNVEGSITVNGKERNVRTFRKTACFIMQEDHHHENFTVSESMHISCNIKLGNGVTSEKKVEMINEILTTLGLETAANTRAGNLSGGQRKRLSVALELVNNPPIMFFDEPTSGLDSQSSFQCINLLNTLAREGRTIICTIHQPSARLFEKFDNLYAISSGTNIYGGEVSSLVPFLSSNGLECPSYHNPADYLIEVASSPDYIERLSKSLSKMYESAQNSPVHQRNNLFNGVTKFSKTYLDANGNNNEETNAFLNSGTNEQTKIQIIPDNNSENSDNNNRNNSLSESMFQTSIMEQTCILIKRNFVNIMRDSMLTKLRIVSHILIGILFGALFFDIGTDASKIFSNSGFLFCCLLFMVFAGMMPTLLTFPIEMKVFIREHHNSWYSLKSYFMAKTLADIPFQAVYPIIFVAISYFMSGQPVDFFRFSMFSAVCVLVSFAAQSFSLVIGAGMEIQEATFIAPVLTIPVLLLSGFFVTIETIPAYLRWTSYTSYMKYGYECAMLALYGFERPNLDCKQAYCHYKYPTKFLKERDLPEEEYFYINMGILLLFCIVFRIISYFILRWRIRKDR